MDSEEKELLKKLLKKVTKLEEDLDRRDKIIQELQEKKEKDANPIPKFPEVDTKGDRLAKVLIQKAREKAIAQHQNKDTLKAKEEAEILKKEVSFAELARYAIKHRLLKEGKETTESSGEEETKKVYLD